MRDWPRMMIDVRKLQDSEFNRKATPVPLAWMAGHKLWYRAFHQFPAGSLPAEDGELCQMADLGAGPVAVKAFRKIKPLALHGWTECSDGRLYHKTVAMVVLEVWIDKLLLKLKSGAGNARRHAAKGYTFDAAPVVLSLETAGAYLAMLDPEAKGLEKIRRRSERDPSDVRKGSERAPTGSPLGPHSDSERAPSVVRLTSQVEVEVEVEDSSLRSEDNTGQGAGAGEALAEARRAQLASLQLQLHEAGGNALADFAVSPGLANLSPILNLTEPAKGEPCDLERDVLPVIRQRCARARPHSVRSWNFFIDAIVEARDVRLRGAPPITEASHDDRPGRAPGFDPDTDSRRADTDRRRDAWSRLAAQRDGAPAGGDGDGGAGGPSPEGSAAYPRLAHAR